jgi:hypothetical protein
MARSHGRRAAGQAAKAVGVPRATLYRWKEKPEPESRRPHRPRRKRWTSELARAVEELRNDNPMWGKRKIAVLLRREGFAVSISTVGRILAHLVTRGAVVPVPLLRRRPAAKRIRFRAKERYARRLPKGRKAKSPGELVQIDTLFINIRPDKPVKHFTAYDPIAKWTIGRVSTQASATSAIARQALERSTFPGTRHSGRWWSRVQVRLRSRMPGARARALRAAAQAARPQRLRRTRPINVAI